MTLTATFLPLHLPSTTVPKAPLPSTTLSRDRPSASSLSLKWGSAAMKQRQWQQKNSNLLGVEQQTAVSMPGEAAREGSCQGVSIVYRA